MMCVRTYREKTPRDFADYSAWVDFVNENERYSREEIENPFGFLSFGTNVKKVSELPSSHPYWRWVNLLDKKNEIEKINNIIPFLIKNPDQIKYYFNDTTTISMLEDLVIKKTVELNKQ